MPKLQCRCGETLSYGQIPCPIEGLYISDVEYDKFVGEIDAESLYSSFKHFLRCPTCRRLWLFEEGYQNEPEEYMPVRAGDT